MSLAIEKLSLILGVYGFQAVREENSSRIYLQSKKDPDVKNARQLAKVANFGLPGGLGVKKLVVYARTNYGVILTEARATRDGRPAWWLSSDNPGVGVDSRHGGPIAAEDVLGVARVRVWPRPSLLRGMPPRSA